MATFMVGIDFGHDNNLAVTVRDSTKKVVVASYVIDILEGKLLKNAKQSKMFYRKLMDKITPICRDVRYELGISCKKLWLIPERQLSYDLILLQGLVTGAFLIELAHFKPSVKMVRNMDSCHHFKIPCSKKEVKKQVKKAMTIQKVAELIGSARFGEHESDALLNTLYWEEKNKI